MADQIREGSQVTDQPIRNLTPNDDVFNQDRDSGQAIPQPQTINALAGDDLVTLSILGGSLVNGQLGRDTLIGEGSSDTVAGNGGSDSILVNAAGGFGFGDNLPNQIDDIDNANFGPAANDTLIANQRASLYGGSGDDFLQGISGSNWFSGNRDNDVIVGGLQGRDSIYGGRGADSIGFFVAAAVNNLGLQGLPLSASEEGNNFISANSGTDLVVGAGDRDRIYGGKGGDTVAGIGSQLFVSGDLGNDVVLNLNREASVAFSNLDAVQTTSRSTLLGGDGDDSIRGAIGNFGDGRNSLVGGAGNDTLRGWASRDTLEGGSGDDLISSGLPDDSLNGLVNQNGVPLNSTNYFGQNVLDGGEGNDTLVAGAITDVMIGGVGNDSLSGLFNEASGGVGNDTIDATGIGTEISISQITLRGGLGNDVLLGNSNPGVTNLFNDGSGNDFIQFGGTANRLIGDGGGNDTVVGVENGTNSLTLSLVEGSNTLIGALGDDSLVTGGGSDSLRGFAGRDTLSSGAGNDILWGGSGSDSLIGGAGNDTLYGQSNGSPTSPDVLTGGDGRDRFGFFGNRNADLITDFNPEDDFILLQGNSYLDGSDNALTSEFEFVQVPSGANYRPNTDPRTDGPTIIYERNPRNASNELIGAGLLKYDPDGNQGDGSEVLTIARFTNSPNLTGNDILVI